PDRFQTNSDWPRPKRYSRWSIAAAALSIVGIIDVLTMALSLFEPLRTLVRAMIRQGTGGDVAVWVLVLYGFAGAAGCVVLGEIALSQVRRQRNLRGTGLAVFAIITGWLGMLFVTLAPLAVVALGYTYSGATLALSAVVLYWQVKMS